MDDYEPRCEHGNTLSDGCMICMERKIWKAQALSIGEIVRVRQLGDSVWTLADVAVASPVSSDHTQSVGLLLNAPVRAGDGLVLNALPLTIDYATESIISLLGHEYEIEVSDR